MHPKEKHDIVTSYLIERGDKVYKRLRALCKEASEAPPAANSTITVESGKYTFELRFECDYGAAFTLLHSTKRGDAEKTNTIHYLVLMTDQGPSNPLQVASPYQLREFHYFLDCVEEAMKLLHREYVRELEKAWQYNQELLEIAAAWKTKKK